jgi:hypothetical protein
VVERQISDKGDSAMSERGTEDTGMGSEGDDRRVGRRDAIKRGAVGAGVMGVVWAAPAIQGLSLRPDYAAAASGSVTAHCTADYKSDQTLGCTFITGDAANSQSGHQTADIPGNCGKLSLSIDQFWADISGFKRGTTANNTDTACDPQNGPACDSATVTRHDANGNFRLVTIKRTAGNINCKFADVKFDGVISNFDPPHQHTANPKTGNHGSGASESGDQLQVAFINDPNFRGDVGRPPACGGKAHIHIRCT